MMECKHATAPTNASSKGAHQSIVEGVNYCRAKETHPRLGRIYADVCVPYSRGGFRGGKG